MIINPPGLFEALLVEICKNMFIKIEYKANQEVELQ